MAGYGTYQGVEKALGHLSNTFSNVMEMKQKQLESNRQFKLQENQDVRQQQLFDINKKDLEFKLAEDERKNKEEIFLAKQKEQERIQDATPRPLSQDPFLNYIESFSPESANQMKNDMKIRGYIQEGAGGFNVVNTKQYYAGLESSLEGKQRAMSFMAAGRQDLEAASTKLKAIMADPKTKPEQIPGIQQKLADIGSKLTWVTSQGTELEKHILEEQNKTKSQQDLEAQKLAGQEKITGMETASREKIAELNRQTAGSKTTDTQRERLILSYLNQAKANAIKYAFANKPDMATNLMSALSSAQTEEQQNQIMNSAETQMDEKQSKIYDNAFKTYIHKNAPDDIVSELENRWKRGTDNSAGPEYTDKEKQQALELLRKRGKI